MPRLNLNPRNDEQLIKRRAFSGSLRLAARLDSSQPIARKSKPVLLRKRPGRKKFSSRTIGLFGGSFNPAHSGHMLVANCGLRQAGLDQIWWLVSPGNPLKQSTHNYLSRLASVKALDLPSNMLISEAELELGTRYTIDLIRKLQHKYPAYNFVYLMGADNLSQLPEWKDWKEIMLRVPLLIIARPGKTASLPLKARLGLAARYFDGARLPEIAAKTIGHRSPPCWTYLTPRLNSLSSTQIREQRVAR